MKLKPCPFCGGEAFMESWVARKGFEANVHCNSCSAMVHTITYDFEEQAEKNAIEAWNRREPREKIVEKLEEYKNLECDDPNEDIDEEVEDAEELYDLGRSQGKLEAYLNAIEIVKDGAV